MATNKKKSSGLATLAKLATGNKTPAKKKTTAPKKKVQKKPAQKEPTSSVSRSRTPITVTGSKAGLSSLNASDFADRIVKIAESISLRTRWDSLGPRTVDELDMAERDLIDVSTESEDIQSNFNVISNQVSILSNFVAKLDYKFKAFETNIKNGVVKIAAETAKNQVSLVKNVNSQLKTLDSTIDKFQARVDTHDKQLDELYAEIRNSKKTAAVSDFLANSRKSKTLSAQTEQDINSIDPDNNAGGVDWNKLAAVGGAAFGGMAALTGGALKLGGKVIRGAGRAGVKGAVVGGAAAKKVSKSAWMRLIVIVERKLGPAVAKRLALAGATAAGSAGLLAIPALLIGIGLTLWDAYDIYQEWTSSGDSEEQDKPVNTLITNNEEQRSEIKVISTENITIQTKKKIELKAEHIIFDAARIEFKGKTNLPAGALPDGVTQEEKAGPNPNFRPRGNPSTGQLVTQDPNDKTPLREPSTQSGRTVTPGTVPYMGRGSTGNRSVGEYDGQGNARGSPATPQVAKKKNALSQAMETSNGMGLKQQRAKFKEELDKDPELRKMVAAMAASETGTTSLSSQTAIIETMMNRAAARGTTLRDVVEMKPGGQEKNYYAPYFDGAFNKRSAQIANDPELQKRLDQAIDAAVGGSNISNYATDNSSAGVAASARRTQTITGQTESGETLSRKDRAEYAETHGVGVTKRNRAWYESTKRADEEAAKNKYRTPGMYDIAAKNEKTLSLLQKSEQKRLDYKGKTKPGTEIAFTGSSRVEQKQGSVAAIRKGALKPQLVDQLDYAAAQTGVQVEVTSGGQRMEGARGATGSTRHDHGGAADLKLYRMDKDGNKVYLDMRNAEDQKIMAKFMTNSVKAGATGVGAGLGYMGGQTMHIGGGRETTWGGAEWVRPSWEEGIAARKGFDLAEWKSQQEKPKEKTPRWRKGRDTQNLIAQSKPTEMKNRGITTFAGVQKKQEKPKVVEERKNVAQNGAISGGKPKMVDEPQPKKQEVAQTTGTQSTPTATKTTSTAAISEPKSAPSSSYNNTADSIPAGPSDNGYGDYKLCLI